MKSLVFLMMFIMGATTTYSQQGWLHRDLSPGNLVSINFVDENTGFIFRSKNILKSTNRGTTWVDMNVTIPNDVIIMRGMFLNSQVGIFNIRSTVTSTSPGLYVTINGGTTWNQAFVPAQGFLDMHSCMMISESVGFASAVDADIDLPVDSKIYKTTNSGIDWNIVDEGGGANNFSDIMFINAHTGFNCRFSILRTTNSGNNWHLLSQTSRQQTKFSKAFGDTMYMSSAQGFVTKSTNLGVNWIEYHTGLSATLNDLYFIDNQTGFAVGDAGSIVKTTNGGSNWIIQNSGTTKKLNEVWFLNKDSGFIAGDSGLLLVTYNGGVTSLSQNHQSIPDNFKLYQNFPNPFNPSTMIRFDIVRSSRVRLSVYDISGKKLNTLVDQNLSPGSYTYGFNAENLPGGVYFYRIEAANFVQTKKMLLMK